MYVVHLTSFSIDFQLIFLNLAIIFMRKMKSRVRKNIRLKFSLAKNGGEMS